MLETLKILFSTNNIKLLVLSIILDLIFGILRAIKEKGINSAIGIDGIIRKVGMLISVLITKIVDYIISIDLLFLVPEVIKNVLNLHAVGVSDLFALLFIVFECLSVLKNMVKCELPIPKKLQEVLQKLLTEFTSEIKESDKK